MFAIVRVTWQWDDRCKRVPWLRHELSPALLRFTHKQRMYFKNMLEGYCVGLKNLVLFVTIEPAPEHFMDFIINRLRKQDPTKSSKLSFIVEADLYNIVQRFNMIPGWRQKDDVTSLQMWHDENNVDDGIRCFELPQDSSGRGFLLGLCMRLIARNYWKYTRYQQVTQVHFISILAIAHPSFR
ncbi:hypothetical protein COOONC_04251 [Cooperia oncophora]